MNCEIYKDFTFEAAHRLASVPPDHKCARLHGHSFHVRVVLRGPVQETSGWVQDFADISEAWGPLKDALDHRYLNDVGGLVNPTSENIARWIWNKLKDRLPMLIAVEVKETCTSGGIYRGD